MHEGVSNSSGFSGGTGYSPDVDFTKVGKGTLHPVDARGQYVSPKPTSKRNKRLSFTQ